MMWIKSSFSNGTTDCVELATDGTSVYVRDSKAPDAGTLSLSADAWRAFLDDAKSGELDDFG